MRHPFSSFDPKFPGAILMITASGAGTAICAMNERWSLMGICIVLWIISVLNLRHLYLKIIRKITYTFDALDDRDFSIRFNTLKVNNNDRLVNESLNRIMTIIKNVTDDLREREKFFETTINSVNIGIMVLDRRGNVIQKNMKAMQLTGMHILIHCSQLNRVDPGLEKMISDILPGEHRQATITDETGSRILSADATAAIMRGQPVRIITINDISGELNENEIDSWTRLIRVLTHEIMNSITPIVSLSETLQKKVAPGTQVSNGLETINKTCGELINFVDNYRKFTHIPVPEPSLFYVRDLLERMKILAKEQVTDENVRITANVEPQDLLVYADERLISHVITNLIRNAVHAIADSGTGDLIGMSARNSADDHVVIDVYNNGPMIPEDIAGSIFIPFFTTKKSGTGIGLSISKQIMRLSGGNITLITDKARRMTTFRLVFN